MTWFPYNRHIPPEDFVCQLVNKSDKMSDLANLTTSALVVRKLADQTNAGQSECIKGQLLRLRAVDAAANSLYFNSCHNFTGIY